MKNRKILLLVLFLVVLPFAYSDGANPTDDAYVDQGSPTTTTGSAASVSIRSNPSFLLHGYFGFNLSNASDITHANFSYYVNANNSHNDKIIYEFYYCDDSFDESVIDWNGRETNVTNCQDDPFARLNASNFTIGRKIVDNVSGAIFNETSSGDGAFTILIKPVTSASVDEKELGSKDSTNETIHPFIEYTDYYLLDDCTTSTILIANYSIYDEKNNSLIDSSDTSGTYNYTLDGTSYTQYDLSKSNTNNFSICISSYVDPTTDYLLSISADDYPLRRYNVKADDFSGTLPDGIPLYLLHEDDGIYARFKTVDTNDNALSSVLGTMETTIEGLTQTIEVETSDDSGIATFWVDPNTDYVFTFTRDGYETQIFSLRPTTSEIYTVVMGSTASTEGQSIYRGITYEFFPKISPLANNTLYNFSFNLSSSYYDLLNCTLFIKDENGIVINESASSFNVSSCNIGIQYDVNNLTKIVGEALYYVNTSNVTLSYTWFIKDVYTGEFSIKTFIDDIKNFTGAGFNDFTKLLIAFVIVFLVTAAASKTFGLSNPEGIIILMDILVWLMSYVGFLSISYTGFPSPFDTFLQNYFIAIIMTLLTGAYLIWRHG